MSGLELNVPKTVCIPLWPEGMEEIPRDPTFMNSGWSNLRISNNAPYLGFSSGPGKGTSSWDGPFAKYTKRVDRWGGLEAGAQFATVAFNTLAFSTLLYIAQLEEPPEWVLRGEEVAVRTMIGGHGNWLTPEKRVAF